MGIGVRGVCALGIVVTAGAACVSAVDAAITAERTGDPARKYLAFSTGCASLAMPVTMLTIGAKTTSPLRAASVALWSAAAGCALLSFTNLWGRTVVDEARPAPK